MKYALILDLVVVSVYDDPPVSVTLPFLLVATSEQVRNGMRYVNGVFEEGSYNDFLNLRNSESPEMLQSRAMVVDVVNQMGGFL